MFISNAFKTGRIKTFFSSDLKRQHPAVILSAFVSPLLLRRSFTIEEDEEDARVRELLSTQQVDVLHSQVEGQFDDRTVLHVGGDVRHQSQVLHQTARLQTKTMRRTRCRRF